MCLRVLLTLCFWLEYRFKHFFSESFDLGTQELLFCGINLSCPSVFRVCEYISTLEHTHFSDGTSQPCLTITQSQQAPGGPHSDTELGDAPQEQTPEQETTLSSNPVIQPVSIQELVKESSKGRAFDFRGGSLLCGTSAAKAVLTLSTQADR